MRKAIIPALFAFSFLSMAAKCSKDKKQAGNCDGVMCTAMFAMVNITVTDSVGNIVKLDDAYTLRLSNNSTIRTANNSTPDGSYTVLDDSYQKQLVNATDSFRFIGIKNGKQVVKETFVIGADCCHINKQSGKTEVVANL